MQIQNAVYQFTECSGHVWFWSVLSVELWSYHYLWLCGLLWDSKWDYRMVGTARQIVLCYAAVPEILPY